MQVERRRSFLRQWLGFAILILVMLIGYVMFEHRLLERVVPNHPYPDLGRILVYRKVVKKPSHR